MLSIALAVLIRVSATCTVKLYNPPAVGVPEITPSELNPSPGGKLPPMTLQLYGGSPPDAASVLL